MLNQLSAPLGSSYTRPMLHTFLTLLIVFAMLGALGTVIFGVVGMFRNTDPRRSNKLMQYRVLFQAVALGLAALLMYATRK